MRRSVIVAGIVVAVAGCAAVAASWTGSQVPLEYVGGILVFAGALLAIRGLLLPPVDEDARAPWVPDAAIFGEDDYAPPPEKAPPGTLEVGQPRAPKIPPPGREP